jgi:hypothetical protein
MTRFWPGGKPIVVRLAGDGTPQALRCFGRWWTVAEVCNRWRTRQGWWREEGECWREDWKLLTREGVLCLAFHDLRHDAWFLERIYD